MAITRLLGDVCDGTLYYEADEAAHPDSPVVLYLHGAGCNHTMWTRVRQHLRALGYGGILLDLRGEGRSFCTHEEYDVGLHVQDIERVLEKERVARVILVGYSMGASVAMAFAAARPERVAALVLLSSSYNFTKTFSRTPARQEFLRRVQTMQATSIFISKQLRHLRDTDEFYPDLSDARYKNFTKFLMDCFFDPTRGDCELIHRRRFKILDWDLWDAMPRITAPVCLIHGDEDMLVPVQTVEEMRSRLPDVRMVRIVKRCGHNLVLQRHEEVNNAITQFLVPVAPPRPVV